MCLLTLLSLAKEQVSTTRRLPGPWILSTKVLVQRTRMTDQASTDSSQLVVHSFRQSSLPQEKRPSSAENRRLDMRRKSLERHEKRLVSSATAWIP
eukprot:17965_1